MLRVKRVNPVLSEDELQSLMAEETGSQAVEDEGIDLSTLGGSEIEKSPSAFLEEEGRRNDPLNFYPSSSSSSFPSSTSTVSGQKEGLPTVTIGEVTTRDLEEYIAGARASKKTPENFLLDCTANNRTLQSWTRTSLSLIVFGGSIASNNFLIHRSIGAVFVILGVIYSFTSIFRYERASYFLHKGRFPVSVIMVTITSFVTYAAFLTLLLLMIFDT